MRKLYTFAPAMMVSRSLMKKYDKVVEVEKEEGGFVSYWEDKSLKRLQKGDFHSLYAKVKP